MNKNALIPRRKVLGLGVALAGLCAGCAVLPMNAVTTSGKPEVFSTRPIHGASSDDGSEDGARLRSKLYLAVSSQPPATLTQQAMAELIRTTLMALYKTPG